MAHSYKCPNCAANLLFDPDAKRMVCGFCASKISPHDIVSKEGKEGFFVGDEWEDAEKYNCGNCGAEFVIGEAALTQTCAYCESPSIIRERMTGGARPAHIIPFRYGKENAEDTFYQWCKSKRFLPKKFIRKLKVKGLTGVYIPVWLYDYPVDVDINVKMACMDETDKTMAMHGLSGMALEALSKSDVIDRHKQGFLFWQRVPVDASSRIDQHKMELIEPFNYRYMQPFESKYLSGFLAERPEVEKELLDKIAYQRVKDFVVSAAVTSVQSDGKMLSYSDSSQYHPPVAEYALLPVWFLQSKYMGKDYLFVLNGQTGAVAGDSPMSIWKLVAVCIALSVTVIPLFIILGIIGRMLF